VIPLRTNRELTSHQISDLVAIITHLNNQLPHAGDTSVPTPHPEANTSMEAALIRACNRLDDILDDSARWKLPDTTNDGHTHMQALARSEAQILELQAELVKLQVFAAQFRQKMVVDDLLASPSVPPAERAMPDAEVVLEKRPQNKRKKR
jgi:hypothetical protein